MLLFEFCYRFFDMFFLTCRHDRRALLWSALSLLWVRFGFISLNRGQSVFLPKTLSLPIAMQNYNIF